jgi:hypothetical protein
VGEYDPFDPIELQRWGPSEPVTVRGPGGDIEVEADGNTLLALMDGDLGPLAKAAEIQKAREYLGLPRYHNDGTLLFEEYARICRADRSSPDTVAWYEKLGLDSPVLPPVSFDDFTLALYRADRWQEPWACPVEFSDRDRAAARIERFRSEVKKQRAANRSRSRSAYSEEGKQNLVREYWKAKASGLFDETYWDPSEHRRLTQEQWAQQHNITGRTLRRYLDQYPELEPKEDGPAL